MMLEAHQPSCNHENKMHNLWMTEKIEPGPPKALIRHHHTSLVLGEKKKKILIV